MDETTIRSEAGEQLRNFGEFLHAYDKKLQSLIQTSPILANTVPFDGVQGPVEINFSSNRENLSLLKLLESDKQLNKTLLTFTHICEEVTMIMNDARHMQMRFLYIDEDLSIVDDQMNIAHNTPKTKLTNDKLLVKMSYAMEFLFNMQFLIQRCTLLANNLLHQCGAFLESDIATLEFRFFDIFDYLADILLQLLLFDEILGNSCFRKNWPHYKKTVETIVSSSKTFDSCSAVEKNGLANCVMELDFLFSGIIFRNFMDSMFSLKDKISTRGVGHLLLQVNEYMKQNLQTLDKLESNDLDDLTESKLLVRLNAFCVVFYDFCGQISARHVKHMLELNAKHHGIVLVGNISWNPTVFLRRHAETLIKTYERLLSDTKRQNQLFLQTRVQNLQRDCHAYCTQVLLWTMEVNEILEFGPFELKLDEFRNLATMLLLGMRYVGQISFVVKALVNAHIELQVPMTKPTLLSVCKLLELLKIIKNGLQKQSGNIAKVMHCILQYLQYKVLYILSTCKKKLSGSRKSNQCAEGLAAIKIAEKCMNGPPTYTRILTAKLAISATNSHNRVMSPDQYNRFKSTIDRMELLCDYQENLKCVCDTSFVYWHQSIFSSYLKLILSKKIGFQSFQYLLSSADDCVKTLEALQLNHLNITTTMKKSNFDSIRNVIISSLCAQIETFLRLEVHSTLQLDRMNPFEQDINDYRDLLNMCPIEMNGNYIVLKNHVENYLSAMFYNLTTISLQDWKTYEEMRHLAIDRFALHPIQDDLPNQTLEQGLDILEIMRNIHVFVSKFSYNMNEQVFVEIESSNNHLDTIGIQHMANSLRTHGSGVINTTVNFTYQFLRQKFYTFSQFLYDEQIRSRLMREMRAFAQHRQQDKYPLYPYERAEAFNMDIRKLGLSKDNQTYIDLFRKVITHVGNAMGYIRLVRSGNFHANYNASQYLPHFNEELKFVQLCKDGNLHESTVTAAENFEAAIKNLTSSFSESTNYFKLLLKAFYPFFQNPHNVHLKNFFLIVPPLIVNHVEFMLNMKEKIEKKDPDGTILFDDGFALGLAYILKLLKQMDDFNSLQWFNTVRDRFSAELKKVKELQADANRPAKRDSLATMQYEEKKKLQQTLVLTERRIKAYQREYNLLFYTLGSAKIFFM